MVFAVGCPPAEDETPEEPQQPQEPQQQTQEIDISELITQWVDSGHSNLVVSAAQRDNCMLCHDGGAFAEQVDSLEELERDFPVAIDCQACHTGHGIDLMEAGTVSIPTAENFEAGNSAQCLACHNERKVPDIDDENRSAPHHSSQAGIFTGTGGIQVEDFDYQNSPHVNIDNACIACHMTPTEAGWPSHTFVVDNAEAACGQCHKGIEDINLEAKADYDGDGKVSGFTDEIEGLLNKLEEAISEALDGGSFETSSGAIKFTDGAGKEIKAPNEVYQAAYNYLLVSQDGSLGIHNPSFVVQLLQQSYKALTGEDVPDADIL